MAKRIAIIGGGFAGMATCWSLLQSGLDVTLFDPLPPGASASGISAGLLHPYIGRKAKRSWRASEGIEATKRLLEVASCALGRPVYKEKGLLRLPKNEEQKRDFLRCAREEPDAEWWERERVQEALPGSAAWAGLYIRSGISVDTPAYLEGLRLACKEAHFVEERIDSIETLRPQFDRILVTAGAASDELVPTAHPPLGSVRGEILQLRWPKELPLPLLPVCMPKYLIPNDDGKTCLLGATYERGPSSDKKSLQRAASRLYPDLLDAEVIERRSGERATLPGHRPPSWVQIDSRVWRFAGLGSRGLLYHALLTSSDLILF